MEKLATENLFLLEFLVDSVKMDKCDCDTPPGELCVSFQFLDNDPLDVCEADFSPEKKMGKDDDNTKSGKSCLFSLTPEQVQKSSSEFDVVVSIFKKMQPGWLPEKICVGTALISIANLFVELIESVEMSTETAPSAKTLKDTFEVGDSQGNPVGKIGIYIRMSCFGKLIVTQFQMNLQDKSVLFKDKGGQSLYRYKKAKKNSENRMEELGGDSCGMGRGGAGGGGGGGAQWNQNCPEMACGAFGGGNFSGAGGFGGGMGVQQQNQSFAAGAPGFGGQCPPNGGYPPDDGMLPCSECNMSNFGGSQPPQMMQTYNAFGGGGGGGGGGGFPQGPPPCLPPDQFNSQMLTPCIECGQLMDMQPPPMPMFDGGISGQDPPGNYQEIGASMGGNALTIRVHKDRNTIEQVENGSLGSGGSCCCALGNMGGGKSKQPPQNLCVSPGVTQGDKVHPFAFKMSGNGAAANNVTINPPVGSKPDGTKYTEIADPDREVFVLRIGKKSEGVQKKANLELELCTPRGPEIKPIPKKETRDSQYEARDCEAGGGGKKGKGKKGKGKGKKGKKGKK